MADPIIPASAPEISETRDKPLPVATVARTSLQLLAAADTNSTTKKPALPDDVFALIGIYRAALADAPQDAPEMPATIAAQSILDRFTPHEHQAQRWLVRGLAAEIMSATEPRR